MTGVGSQPPAHPAGDAPDRVAARAHLLDAAARTLVRHGSTATTMDDIALAAGTDLATLHSFFRTKSDLVFAIYEALAASNDDLWRALDDILTDRSRAGLNGWLGDALDWWVENAAVLRVVREAAVMDTDLGTQLRDHFVDSIGRLTGFLAGVPKDQRSVAKLTLQMLVLQLDQVCFEWLAYRPGTVDRQSILRPLTDIWTRSLSPW